MKPLVITIFAKAPQPGFAKTRLIPALGEIGAAKLAQRLLMHTLTESLAAGVGRVELCVTPSMADPVWRTLTVPDAVQWSEQGEGDLGARMARRAQRAIESGESILLIGTDCPKLDASRLRRAANALQQSDAVLVPAADGGYVLLGLRRFHETVFSGIPWSTDSVARETLSRMGQLDWTVQRQSVLHDIDEPGDLRWLPVQWLKTVSVISAGAGATAP
jgi:rSAM/selenodomain-associated transferase 1